MTTTKLSIIIPAYNEAASLPKLLTYLENQIKSLCGIEVIVVDGGSSDQTVAVSRSFGIHVIDSPKGRAIQMNNGAKVATGVILYFLHCDSFPPNGFINQILEAQKAGKFAGCYRLKFDWNHWFLNLNAWFTRFNVNSLRFGDQSLFIVKSLFEQIGGFREDLVIMEDQEIIYRISEKAKFFILPEYITTSARKYRLNGVYRMQYIFFYIFFSYQLGATQEKLVAIYKALIKTN